jgi:hypothetical protein
MVKPWISEMESAATRVNADAATGDPDSTNRAPIQPKPKVEPAFFTRKPWC